MRGGKIWRGTTLVVLFVAGCNGGGGTGEDGSQEWTLDHRSWHMGTFAAMAELVDYGVKRLALSSALPPDEMDLVIDDAIRIAGGHNVEVYREVDFPVTDLFSAELTEGKHVLLLCHPSTYREYQALKVDKERLQELGQYQGEARTEIARRLGRLLSYPDSTIERELIH
jgi:hypothetical protein